MQDVDFLKNDNIDFRSLLLWLFISLVLLSLCFFPVIKNYSDLLNIKSQWESRSLKNKKDDDIELLQNNSSSQNDHLSHLFNYFANVSDEYIVVNIITISKMPSIKVAGEAKNIGSLSTFVDKVADDDLFANFNSHRLLVDQIESTSDGVRWSIEWLK